MSNPYIVNEIQLSYKCHTNPLQLPKVTCAEDAYKILIEQWDENRLELAEDFKLLLLNRASKVLGVYHMSSGGTAGTVADAKLIFVAALKTNAHSIILAHNHPSGNLRPSTQDRELTQQLTNAGRFLGIEVRDHLIVTPNGYYSFTGRMAYHKVERSTGTYYECQPPF